VWVWLGDGGLVRVAVANGVGVGVGRPVAVGPPPGFEFGTLSVALVVGTGLGVASPLGLPAGRRCVAVGRRPVIGMPATVGKGWNVAVGGGSGTSVGVARAEVATGRWFDTTAVDVKLSEAVADGWAVRATKAK
jgi:hypothetical protein